MTETQRKQTPWTLDKVKIGQPPQRQPIRQPKTEGEPMAAIVGRMEALRASPPAHRQQMEVSRPCQAQPTIPAWLMTHVDALPTSFSDNPECNNMALLAKALRQRVTPSELLLIVEGPRRWNSSARKLEPRECSPSELQKLEWCGKICLAALDERDEARTSRTLATLMAMPSGGDKMSPDAAEMYLAVLEPYPVWAIEAAAVAWARSNRWRPMPADLAALCESEVMLPRRIIKNAEAARLLSGG